MKFKFESQFIGFGSPKNTMEFEVDQLQDVLEYFEQFLRGAGYVFDGQIDIIPYDEYYGVSEPETPESIDVDMDGRC
jgi:hypothetical protein